MTAIDGSLHGPLPSVLYEHSRSRSAPRALLPRSPRRVTVVRHCRGLPQRFCHSLDGSAPHGRPILTAMQHIEDTEETGVRSVRVRKLLEEAERSAESAIRTMRSSVASAPPGSVGPLLEDVDRLFCLIDAADLRAELARVTSDDDDAVEHAEDARSLAIAADEEAQLRAGRWAR